MPTVTYGTCVVTPTEDETVLEALLRAGADVPYSCRAGSCMSCLLRARSGTPPAAAQVGLRDSLVEQNCFLPCIARCTADLHVERPNAATTCTPARIAAVEPLSPSVARVTLEVAGDFDFRAGQFLNLVRGDGVTRSYSIASLPAALPQLELHVRRIPGGALSSWLCSPDTVGSVVQLRGPSGDCFYLPQHADQSILLVGTGTGLAPLLGIVRAALDNAHRGPLMLYHGALNASGLYLVDELRALEAEHQQLHYHPCVRDGEAPDMLSGPLDEIVLTRHAALRDWRVYLCGDPDFVHPMRKRTFLAGANAKQIHADAFLMRPSDEAS